MDHHIAVIEQDPFGFGQAFVTQRFSSVFGQILFDLLGQRLHMGTGGPGADYKHLRDDEEVSNLQENDVLALLVGYGIGSQPSGGHCVDGLNLLAQRARIGPMRPYGRRPQESNFSIGQPQCSQTSPPSLPLPGL